MQNTIGQIKRDWGSLSFFSSKYDDTFFNIISNNPPEFARPYCDRSNPNINKEFLLTSDAVLDFFLSSDTQTEIQLPYLADQLEPNEHPTNDEINKIRCTCDPKQAGMPYICVEYNELSLPNEEPVPTEIKKMLCNLSIVSQTLKGYIPSIMAEIFNFKSMNSETDLFRTNKTVQKIRRKFTDIISSVNKDYKKLISKPRTEAKFNIFYNSYGITTLNSTYYIDHQSNSIVYLCNLCFSCSYNNDSDFQRQIPSTELFIPIYKLVIVVPMNDLANYYSFLFIDNGPLQWTRRKNESSKILQIFGGENQVVLENFDK